MELPDRGVIAVVDPVCSWCWGFATVLDRLRLQFGGDLPFHLLLGGLRPGDNAERLGRIRGFLNHHWYEVQKRSGQRVNHDFLSREDDLLMDTEIPCRAVTVTRDILPESTFQVYHAVQRGLFVENRNVFDIAVLVEIAGQCGLNEPAFAAALDSEVGRASTEADFACARGLGVHGFPTLLAVDAGRIGLLTYGYAPYDRIAGALGSWVIHGFPDSVAKQP